MGNANRRLAGMLLVAFTVLSLAAASLGSSAAAPVPDGLQVREGPRVVLRADDHDAFTRVLPPREHVQLELRTATFQVNYHGFSPQAQAAFQHAVDIWASQIDSPVTIVVEAYWTPLGAGILGAAGPNYVVRDFTGAPHANTWYAAALADRLAGFDQLPANADIVAQFNSNFPAWYFSTDGNPPAGQYDFVSTVLHELGHGLGFYGSMNVSGGQGTWGISGFPDAFDHFTENGAGQPLLGFASPSTQLAAQLTGDDIWFDGTNATGANGGARPKLYAPATWQPGSSYSHLDESTYPPGDANSLMTPALAGAEAVHSPGPITLGILQDIGWTTASTATPPTLSGLPDQTLAVNTQRDNAIDLWAYADDAEDADSALAFTISNTPIISAGVTITGHRYIDIHPAADWTGTTDVVVQVQDTDGLTDDDTFRVTVTASGTTTSTVHLPLVMGNWCTPFYYNETIRYNLDRINAPEAWPCGGPGQGVVVAVIDTGVDLDHPDLQANVVAGATFVPGTSSPDDDQGHGSHVAGVTAGVGNNGGIIGVAPGASIMPLKTLQSDGSGYVSWSIDALTWATDHGADVINMSLGSVYYHQSYQDAVNYAYNHGVLVVASAGNCGDAFYFFNGCFYQDQPSYPGAYSHVMAVASTDQADSQSSFSTQGSYVDIAAPGDDIYSAYENGGYRTLSGTSQASPHVAGLAALIRAARPSYTPDQIAAVIQSSAVDLGSSGKDIQFGWGRIDAAAALELASTVAFSADSSAALAEAASEVEPLTRESAVEFAPGVILVKFRPAISTEIAASVLAGLESDVQIAASIPQIGLLKLSVSPGSEWDVIESLRALPQVEYAEPDLLVHLW